MVGDKLLKRYNRVKTVGQHINQKHALYLALSRIGLKKEAEEILTPEGIYPHQQEEKIRNKLYTVTPESPASDCVSPDGKEYLY